MADVPRQIVEIELDLEGIPSESHDVVKKDVGEHLLNSVLDYMAEGKSPIGGTWKKLDIKYAKKFHDGDRTPRLELSGDMKAALGWEETDNGIIFGILDDEQAPKADGHNNLSGRSSLPLRRFIPDEGEKYRKKIMDGIDDILESYRVDIELDDKKLKIESGSTVTSSLLSDENIIDLIMERLKK